MGIFPFPTFKAKEIFHSYFPTQKRKIVTEILSDLTELGIPKEAVEIWKKEIPTLNELQVKAINEYGLLDGKHLLVSAPTSSGKTMVAEIAAVKACFKNQKSCFLLPLRANS